MIKIQQLINKNWILLLILLLVLLLCLYQITSIPFAVHGDEGETADFARSLLHRPFVLFGVGWYDLPIASFLPHSLMMKLFGENVFADRLGSIIFGVLTLPFFYGLTKMLFTRRIALFATYFLAVSHLWIALSRVGITYVQAAFLVIAGFYFFIKGMHSQKKLLFFISGCVIGACFYSYYAARVAPVILGIYILLSFPFQKNKFLFFKQLLVMGLGFLIVFFPQGIYYISHPHAFLSRTQDVFVFSPGSREWMSNEYTDKNELTILFLQLKKALTISAGDGSWQYGYKGLLLDPPTILLILSGFIFILLNWAETSLFVLVWFLCVLLIGQVLTSIPSPIFLPRFVVGIPALALLTALGLELYLKLLIKHKRISQILIIVACAGIFIFNAKTYFIDYPIQHAISIAGDPNAVNATKISNTINSLPADYNAILITEPNLYANFGTIRFLTPYRHIESFSDSGANNFHQALPILRKSKTIFFFYADRLDSLAALKKAAPDGRENTIINPDGVIQLHTYTLD